MYTQQIASLSQFQVSIWRDEEENENNFDYFVILSSLSIEKEFHAHQMEHHSGTRTNTHKHT